MPHIRPKSCLYLGDALQNKPTISFSKSIKKRSPAFYGRQPCPIETIPPDFIDRSCLSNHHFISAFVYRTPVLYLQKSIFQRPQCAWFCIHCMARLHFHGLGRRGIFFAICRQPKYNGCIAVGVAQGKVNGICKRAVNHGGYLVGGQYAVQRFVVAACSYSQVSLCNEFCVIASRTHRTVKQYPLQQHYSLFKFIFQLV